MKLTNNIVNHNFIKIIIIFIFIQIFTTIKTTNTYGAQLQFIEGEICTRLVAWGSAGDMMEYPALYSSFSYNSGLIFENNFSKKYFNSVEGFSDLNFFQNAAFVSLDVSTSLSATSFQARLNILTSGVGLASRHGEIETNITRPLLFQVAPENGEHNGDPGFVSIFRDIHGYGGFWDKEGSGSSGPTVIRINGEIVWSIPKIEGSLGFGYSEILELPIKIGDVLSIDPYKTFARAGLDKREGHSFETLTDMTTFYLFDFPTPRPAPVPGGILLLGTGLGTLAFFARKRRTDKD